MISYNQLTTILESFATAHKQIKRFGSEFKEQLPNLSTEGVTFPYLFVVPINKTSVEFVKTLEVEVYCIDRLRKDRENSSDVVSDTEQILTDLEVWLEDGQDLLDVVKSYNATPLNNDTLDYVAGWVQRYSFEMERIALCEIPMNEVTPPSSECEDANYIVEYEDGEPIASGTIPSGGSVIIEVPNPEPCADATAVLKNTLDATLSTTDIPSGNSQDIIAPDSDYTVQYENGTLIETGSIASGGSALIEVPNPIVCADATVNVNGAFWDSVPSGGIENVIVRQSSGSTQVGSIQGQYFRIANSTAVLKTTGGTTISTTSIKAEASENIVAPNTTIEVNGTTEGTFNAGSTVDIQLSDSGGVVTPDSVTVVGNDVQIVLADCVGGSVGATLMKTGQTTSYRTGDDGDLEEGRATDFLTLASNNPFGNTNRFTDELGGSTYTNNIVMDWSTYDGSTVTGWYKEDFVTLVLETWANAIDNALSLTVATFSVWRIPNIRELNNIMNYRHANVFNYVPFNNTSLTVVWSSTTDPGAVTNAIIRSGVTNISRNKTLTSYSIRCRTFTVSGTTLS